MARGNPLTSFCMATTILKHRRPPAAEAQPGAVRSTLLERLSGAITEGVFKPGDRLTERELCERFSVSRTSLREALRQLAAEDLIEIIPNKGPVVKRITLDELLDLWEVRTTIECLAARRFATLGTPDAIEALEHSIERLEQALLTRDPVMTRKMKKLFFECFAAGANNKPLEKILAQLNARLSFLWSSSLMLPGRPAESMVERRALLQAIKGRNPEAAHAATILYNEHAKAVAISRLQALEQERMAA
jgi:GntR family transcriptional regulator, trigonelline degradation regulator